MELRVCEDAYSDFLACTSRQDAGTSDVLVALGRVYVELDHGVDALYAAVANVDLLNHFQGCIDLQFLLLVKVNFTRVLSAKHSDSYRLCQG